MTPKDWSAQLKKREEKCLARHKFPGNKYSIPAKIPAEKHDGPHTLQESLNEEPNLSLITVESLLHTHLYMHTCTYTHPYTHRRALLSCQKAKCRTRLISASWQKASFHFQGPMRPGGELGVPSSPGNNSPPVWCQKSGRLGLSPLPWNNSATPSPCQWI